MKVLYYDCFCGISGDMNLGALLDLGVDKDYLLQELGKLPVDSEYEMKINKAVKMGITGTKVDVILKHPDHDQHSHS
ncbi:MAG TPA: TIGR00299 family protein, partial [Firmicutes bacterium]|nr:TIGR00299 family protein [Bacillota bacterium]